MIGLVVLGFFVIYLLTSIWVTKKVASWAKANNKKPWLWGDTLAMGGLLQDMRQSLILYEKTENVNLTVLIITMYLMCVAYIK